MASKSKIAKAQQTPKFTHAARAALQDLRPPAGRVPQVRNLPDLLPQVGRRRTDSRRQEGELVKGTHANMMTDPIADMLTRIRNAVRVERPHVDMPLSKVKRGLAEVLKREGYIWDWEEVAGEPVAKLRIELKYGPNGERVIRHIAASASPAAASIAAPPACARCSTDWESRSSAPAAA